MVVGQIPEPADLLVVGAGPGGYAAALHAARLGRKVTLVDRDGESGVGGVCLHRGCIPSKALIELADHLDGTRRFAAAGLHVDAARPDLSVFQSWKAGIVDRLADGIRGLLSSGDVTVVAGTCRLTRSNQVAMKTPDDRVRFFEFADAVIATGSRPSPPPGLEPDGASVLDTTGILELQQVPESLLVVGAGSSGVELGTAYAKLGSRVTLVEQDTRILPGLEPSLSSQVRRRLDQLGVTVLTGSEVTDVEAGQARVKGPDSEQRVAAATVLVAVGRRPNSDELGLEDIGITPRPDGLLAVNTDRRLSEHLAAIGDVTPGPALAHKATAEARVAAEALSGRRAAFDPQAVPVVVYSDPEIASAGLTVTEARAAGMSVRTAAYPLGASGRAATVGSTQGSARLVIDADTDTIAGVHLVGPHASELIAEGVLAIEMAATAEDLVLSIHPHPTLSEQFAEVAGAAVHARSG